MHITNSIYENQPVFLQIIWQEPLLELIKGTFRDYRVTGAPIRLSQLTIYSKHAWEKHGIW